MTPDCRRLTFIAVSYDYRTAKLIGAEVPTLGARLAATALDQIDAFNPSKEKCFLLTQVTHVGVNNLPEEVNYVQDGEKDLAGSTAAEKKYSNIAKLWQFAHLEKRQLGPRESVEYIEGVGTPCPKVGDSGTGVDFASGMAAARKGEDRIRWMLKQLDQFVTDRMPFVSRINLAVFGFSRGATQARAFVRMLTEALAFERGDELIWRRAGLDAKQPRVVVYFMGVFDTVASVGFGGSAMEKLAPGLV